jgi:hypothetical protein
MVEYSFVQTESAGSNPVCVQLYKVYAPMMKLVNIADLKSAAVMASRFNSGSGHHFKTN